MAKGVTKISNVSKTNESSSSTNTSNGEEIFTEKSMIVYGNHPKLILTFKQVEEIKGELEEAVNRAMEEDE